MATSRKKRKSILRFCHLLDEVIEEFQTDDREEVQEVVDQLRCIKHTLLSSIQKPKQERSELLLNAAKWFRIIIQALGFAVGFDTDWFDDWFDDDDVEEGAEAENEQGE